MKRLFVKKLESWYQKDNRKPLILRGARQVGKSTLVRQFAHDRGLDLLEINLERHLKLDEVFRANDTTIILREFEVLLKRPVLREGVLLFLDEIQATPHALPALRYFYEDHPNLAVVAAGSLLEFVLSDHQFSMPVGRLSYLHMGPMSFGEFLLAMGEEALFERLKNHDLKTPWPVMAHEKLLDYQRQYFFVGGMPESVLLYSQNKSVLEVKDVQRSILYTYQDDFLKYTSSPDERRLLHKIFTIMPTLVGKKIKYVTISRDDRAAEVRSALFLLIKSRLLIEAYHSHCGGIPLKAGRDDKIYKLYFVDVGLLNHLFGLEWPDLTHLEESELINKGIMAEQFVAQHLAYGPDGFEPPELSYWLSEGKGQNAEVDFVVQVGRDIIPVEVKAGASGSLKSLHQFMAEKKVSLACRFDLNMPSRQHVRCNLTRSKGQANFQLLSLPLYFAEVLPQKLKGML